MEYPKFDDFDFIITIPYPSLEYNYEIAIGGKVMVFPNLPAAIEYVGDETVDSVNEVVVNYQEYQTQFAQYHEQYFKKIAAFRRACEAFMLEKYPMLSSGVFDMCWECAEAASNHHGYDAVADSLFEFVDFAHELYLHIGNKT